MSSRPSETLTFTVDWRVFTGGHGGVPSGAAGRSTRRSTARRIRSARSTCCFPWSTSFQSALDTKTGCSHGLFASRLQEGRRKISSDLTLRLHAGKQTQVEKNLVKGTPKTQTASIPACVTDSLSAIFYAASQPLVVGQDVGFPLADSMRTVTVTMKVEAQGRDQDAGGDLRDDPGAADGGRRRGEEPRQYLDLVHGRCTAYPGADSGAAVLGDDYVPPALV